MDNLNSNNKKNNNTIVTVATLLVLASLLVVASVATTPLRALGSRAEGETADPVHELRNALGAHSIVSGDDIYLARWTNNTGNGNEEVLYRASNDAGATFGDKINLSNTTNADSWRVEIAAEGDNVVVSWWETANQTSDISVARISTDAGETFGPLLRLAANGAISGTDEEGEEEEEG